MKAMILKKASHSCQVCRHLLDKFNCKTKGEESEDLQTSPLATKREMKMLYKREAVTFQRLVGDFPIFQSH